MKEERYLTKDDIETMRILFGAEIGALCNQGRWNDAKEMERIRDRLMQALEQILAIKDIINSPVYIQEDVLRYKAICDVLGEEHV